MLTKQEKNELKDLQRNAAAGNNWAAPRIIELLRKRDAELSQSLWNAVKPNESA